MPSVVSLGDGQWVVAWQSTSAVTFDGVNIGSDSDILISRSETNGASWTSPRPLRLGYAAGENIGAGANWNDTDVRLATDGKGRLVAVWSSTDTLARFNETNIGPDADILVSRSSSRGISWTFPSPLNSFAAIDDDTDETPSVTTDRMGTWIVVWASFYEGPGNLYGSDIDIWTAVSVKDGEIWSASSPLLPAYAEIPAGGNGRNEKAPRIGTDELGNWIAVWESTKRFDGIGSNDLGEDSDILYSISNTSGAVWTPPEALNTNASEDGNADDSATTLAVDRSGRWFVAWASNGVPFGGNGANDEEIVATRFLSPVIELLWVTGSGQFGVPTNWDAGRVPMMFDRAAFDALLSPGMVPSSYQVTVNEDVATGRLAVRTGAVTFDLQKNYHALAAASEVADPPILIGAYDNIDTSLIVTNTNAGPGNTSTMTAESLTVGRGGGDAVARLEAMGDGIGLVMTAGPYVIGERGDGVLAAGSGAFMDLFGDIVLGERPLASGRVEVFGTETTMGFGGVGADPARIVIGAQGDGVWAVGREVEPNRSPMAIQEPGSTVEEIILAEQPGSTGSLVVAGGGAQMTALTDRFIVGGEGDASMLIAAGGRLNTTTTELVGLAESPGSTARVDIRGPISRWFETSQAINIGVQGDAVVTVGDGGTLRAATSVNVLPKGTLIGDSRVVGQLQNLGVVRVGQPVPGELQPGAFGVLTVEGRYSQFGPSLSGQTSSGSLFLRIGGDERGVDYDAIDVEGDAFLGGGLFLEIDEDYLDSEGGPAIGQTFNLLDATQRDPSQPTFDVAVVPGFQDNRLLLVNYSGGEVMLEVTTLGRLLGFAEPDSADAISGAPAGIVIANFDRDPNNLPDVIIPVVGVTNQLLLLQNLGNNPNTNEWLGFSVVPFPFDIDDGDPVAVGVIDLIPRDGIADDLVVAFENESGGVVRFFSNRYPSSADFAPAFTGYAIDGTPQDLAVGDVNGDMLEDVVVVSYNETGVETDPKVTQILALAAAEHMAGMPLVLPGAGRPEGVDIDDLDNDKDLLLGQSAEADIVIADAGANAIIVLRNDGAGGFGAPPIVIPAGAPLQEVRLAEINGDGFVDLVGLSRTTGEAFVVINRVTPGEFAPAVPLALGSSATSLVVADLGGSAAPDIACIVDGQQPGERVIRTFRGEVSSGAVTYSDGPEFPTDSNALLLGAADINGMSGSDLIVIGGPDGLRGVGFAQTRLNAECVGDATGDGKVNFMDLNTVLQSFGQTGFDLPADVDFNGSVNFADLNAVLANFGVICR